MTLSSPTSSDAEDRQVAGAGPAAARKVAMIIMAALPLGVTLFAGIALWLQPVGGPGGVETDLLVRVWLATVVLTVIGAVIAWRHMVAPLLPVAGRRAEAPPPEVLRRLQTGLVVCMALIEGAALFGCVVTLIGGGALPAMIGVLMMWSAFALLWPRPGWYGLR